MTQSSAMPRLSPSAYIAEGAIVRGDVTIGDRASVWFNAVVRGDEGPVRIGECSQFGQYPVGSLAPTGCDRGSHAPAEAVRATGELSSGVT